MDQVTRATQLSKINLKNVYYRLRIKAGNKWKIAFRTHYNHYKFLIVLMGLTNALTTFQAYINKAL